MPPLVTTNILQTLVAMGLNSLRENIALARIANRDLERELTGASPGATVNVMVPAPVTTRDVSPDVTPPSLPAVTPTSVPVTLEKWKEAPFGFDDKALTQVRRGFMPTQASEAIRSLVNEIEKYLFTKAVEASFGFVGTPGTTPFATDLSEAISARKVAAQQLMPPQDRFLVLDTEATANALALRAVQDASARGRDGALVTGEIGDLLGMRWIESQLVPQHTAGTGSGYLVNQTNHAVGDTQVTVDTGTGTILAGDIFTVAGDSQTYVVKSFASNVITYSPAAKTAFADNAAVTIKGTHRANLLVQRNAIAFAMAPLSSSAITPAARQEQAVAVDPDSGLALRVEITRQHKQYQMSFDALFGAAVVRPEYLVRIAG